MLVSSDANRHWPLTGEKFDMQVVGQTYIVLFCLGTNHCSKSLYETLGLRRNSSSCCKDKGDG